MNRYPNKMLLIKGNRSLNNKLYSACHKGIFKLVKDIISENDVDINGALSAVCESVNSTDVSTRLDIIEYLIDNGANNLRAALIDCCYSGSLDLVKYLVSRGARTEKCLIGACHSQNLELIKYVILVHRKDGNVISNEIINDSLAQACRTGNMDVVNLILEQGPTNYNGGLMAACIRGHIEPAKLMMSFGTDISSINSSLHLACYSGSVKLVEYLISLGANSYNYALHEASSEGHLELVKLMISLGANDINWALHLATNNRNIEIVKYLVELNGIDCNMAIVSTTDFDIIKILISHGADLHMLSRKTKKKYMKYLAGYLIYKDQLNVVHETLNFNLFYSIINNNAMR